MKKNNFATSLVLFLAAMAWLNLWLAWHSWDAVREGHPDFTIFYSAAKIVRQGLGSRLYDVATQYRIQQEFASSVSLRQGPLPFNHPPFEALIFVPFSLLPYVGAYLLWDLVSLLIFVLPLFLLRPHISLLRRFSVAYWLLALVAFFPTFSALLNGQDISLLLLLFTLVFIFQKKKSEFTAGCCLGLGLFRFQLVLPLMLVWLLQKRKKALLGFVFVALTLALISVAMVGLNASLNYPGSVWRMEQMMNYPGSAVPTEMPNLRGLLEGPFTHLFSKNFSDALLALLSIALVVVAAFMWEATTATTFNLGFSLCVLATLVVSYHTFPYDLSLLALPIALVVDYLSESNRIRGWARVALLGPILLLFLTPLHLFLALYEHRYSLMALPLLFWLGAVAWEVSSQSVISRRRP